MPHFAPIDAAPAVRNSFWAAVVLGCLNLGLATLQPVAGVVAALILFAVAWGLRKGRAWAAIAGICCFVPPLAIATLIGHPAGRVIAASLTIDVILLSLWGRAAAALWSKRAGRTLWPWSPAAAIALIFWAAFHPVTISAGSMEHTLVVGEQALVEHVTWSLGRAPELGDVVVIRYPLDRSQTYIKRVVAGPGDRLRIQEKKLFRNGELVDEPYAFHCTPEIQPFRDNFPAAAPVGVAIAAEEMLKHYVQNGELTIPDGRYFVLGDNRDNSSDSRYWGLITAKDIVGAPVLIYGPRRLRIVR